MIKSTLDTIAQKNEKWENYLAGKLELPPIDVKSLDNRIDTC